MQLDTDYTANIDSSTSTTDVTTDYVLTTVINKVGHTFRLSYLGARYES